MCEKIALRVGWEEEIRTKHGANVHDQGAGHGFWVKYNHLLILPLHLVWGTSIVSRFPHSCLTWKLNFLIYENAKTDNKERFILYSLISSRNTGHNQCLYRIYDVLTVIVFFSCIENYNGQRRNSSDSSRIGKISSKRHLVDSSGRMVQSQWKWWWFLIINTVFWRMF